MGLLSKGFKCLMIGGALYALPSPPASDLASAEPSVQATTFATFTAASETMADASSFCGRRPQVCVTGVYLYSKAAAKAKYSFKLAYEWANPPVATTTSVSARRKTPLRLATLNDAKPTKIEDLLRGPAE